MIKKLSLLILKYKLAKTPTTENI